MPPLVAQGLELATLGMGTVVVFLTLLVIAMMTMSKLVRLTERSQASAEDTLAADGMTIDPKKLAVISAAIHQHRKQQ